MVGLLLQCTEGKELRERKEQECNIFRSILLSRATIALYIRLNNEMVKLIFFLYNPLFGVFFCKCFSLYVGNVLAGTYTHKPEKDLNSVLADVGNSGGGKRGSFYQWSKYFGVCRWNQTFPKHYPSLDLGFVSLKIKKLSLGISGSASKTLHGVGRIQEGWFERARKRERENKVDKTLTILIIKHDTRMRRIVDIFITKYPEI